MLKNTKNNSKELGLVERIQPSTTEIFSLQGIPTGENMPGYTRTHTSKESISFSSPGISKVEQLRDMLLNSEQNPSEGELCLYFKLIQKQYALQINSVFKDLRRWCIEIRARKCRYPIREDFIAKLSEYYKLLCIKDADFPFETYFSNGANDTADAGAYLLCLSDMNREAEELHAIRLLSAVQWLIRERDKLPLESAPIVLEADDVSEEEKKDSCQEANTEDEELLGILTKFQLGGKARNVMIEGKNRPDRCVLTAIMYMYQADNKQWAMNPNLLSMKIVSILPETKDLSQKEQEKIAESIARRMYRALNEMGNIHPENLTVKGIREVTGKIETQARAVFNHWEELYSAVIRCRDAVRKNNVKQSDKEMTSNDKN